MGNHTDKNLNTFSLRSTYTVISTQQSCNKDGSIYTDQTFILRHKHVIAIKKHIKRISASKHIFELYCFDVAVILSGVCLISIFENICNVFFVFYSQLCPLGERILSGFFFLNYKSPAFFFRSLWRHIGKRWKSFLEQPRRLSKSASFRYSWNID